MKNLPDIKRQVDERGNTIFDMDAAFEIMLRRASADLSDFVFEPSTELDKHNALCRKWNKLDYILNSEAPDTLADCSTWRIPEPYASYDMSEILRGMCADDAQLDRVNTELRLYAEKGFLPLLNVCMFLVSTWRERKIVWGVGRGSSVASYCLYLIGMHKIDSLRYGLDVNDFLR
jgi:DNA polymerase III alpha subunit